MGESMRAIVRKRKWRRRSTAAVQWEGSQAQDHSNREREIVSGEKTYAQIIQRLKARIQGERNRNTRRSKMLNAAKVRKHQLELLKHEIFQKARRSGKQQAWHRREIKMVKFGMHGIMQRLLKAHSHIKRVLSALKAEKIKWEVRFVHAIKRTRKMKLAAHLRALWSSRLNKYKLARANLYKKSRQNDILLAREINMRQRIIEKQSGQTKRRMGMEVNRKHAIGHMKETAERYAAHLKEQTLKILKRKQNNNV